MLVGPSAPASLITVNYNLIFNRPDKSKPVITIDKKEYIYSIEKLLDFLNKIITKDHTQKYHKIVWEEIDITKVLFLNKDKYYLKLISSKIVFIN